MITHTILDIDGILIVRPEGMLQPDDFPHLAHAVDPYIEQRGGLNGLLIDAEAFTGWANPAALLSHFQFVNNHHQKIHKVAIINDNPVLSALPHFIKHFINAKVRHFDIGNREDAMLWLRKTARNDA